MRKESLSLFLKRKATDSRWDLSEREKNRAGLALDSRAGWKAFFSFVHGRKSSRTKQTDVRRDIGDSCDNTQL